MAGSTATCVAPESWQVFFRVPLLPSYLWWNPRPYSSARTHVDRVATAENDDSDDLNGHAANVFFAVDQRLAVPDFPWEYLQNNPLPKHPRLAGLPRYSVNLA